MVQSTSNTTSRLVAIRTAHCGNNSPRYQVGRRKLYRKANSSSQEIYTANQRTNRAKIGAVVVPRSKGGIKQRQKCLRSLRRLQQLDPNQPEAWASFQQARAAAKKVVNEAKQRSWAELLWALDKGRGASTGADSIGYLLLQRPPMSVKMALFELLNKSWQSGESPACCWNAIGLPIPKPNRQDSGPAAIRPISVTSCMAKLFERIINRRLITELESSGRLDKR